VSTEDEADDVLEVVASAGPLDPAVVALREFLHLTGALRAVAVVDDPAGGAAGPAVIDCARLAPIAVEAGGRTVHLPHGIELDAPVPDLGALSQLPPFDVDPEKGEVAGPIGGLQHLADGVAALARALGGRNVAMAQFATRDPAAPLSLTARADGSDPIVVSLGEEEFELPPADDR
jgi:hypothetical protein